MLENYPSDLPKVARPNEWYEGEYWHKGAERGPIRRGIAWKRIVVFSKSYRHAGIVRLYPSQDHSQVSLKGVKAPSEIRACAWVLAYYAEYCQETVAELDVVRADRYRNEARLEMQTLG